MERKSFQVADGFEVNLFAADPLLAKPIQMNFDPAGRLWVACSEVYPQIKPGQKANDKIIILEDTKGAGKADKTTVFADGLLIPTGVSRATAASTSPTAPTCCTSRDTDGDGKADKRRVVLSGFGTEDTHHMVHTLRWGPDGMLYFNQSVYIHSHIETPHGVRRLNGGGIWQFRPETHAAGSLLRAACGTPGAITSTAGASRSSPTAPAARASTTSSPAPTIAAAVGAARILHRPQSRQPEALRPARSSAAGTCPRTGSGNLITNDFRGHRVCRFVVTPGRLRLRLAARSRS